MTYPLFPLFRRGLTDTQRLEDEKSKMGEGTPEKGEKGRRGKRRVCIYSINIYFIYTYASSSLSLPLLPFAFLMYLLRAF
jgi:hypothetical protein